MAGKKFDNNHEKSRFLHLEWRVHDTKLVLLGSQQKVLLTEPSRARDTNHAFKVWTDEKIQILFRQVNKRWRVISGVSSFLNAAWVFKFTKNNYTYVHEIMPLYINFIINVGINEFQ